MYYTGTIAVLCMNVVCSVKCLDTEGQYMDVSLAWLLHMAPRYNYMYIAHTNIRVLVYNS